VRRLLLGREAVRVQQLRKGPIPRKMKCPNCVEVICDKFYWDQHVPGCWERCASCKGRVYWSDSMKWEFGHVFGCAVVNFLYKWHWKRA
jgi:hypothetical protein